jgi:hypothetical protein
VRRVWRELLLEIRVVRRRRRRVDMLLVGGIELEGP